MRKLLLISISLALASLAYAETAASRISTTGWPERYKHQLEIGNTLPNELNNVANINKDSALKLEEVQFIVSNYVVVPREEWLHTFSHVAGYDRVVEIEFETNISATLLSRPGGLAELTFSDGSIICLTISRQSDDFRKEIAMKPLQLTIKSDKEVYEVGEDIKLSMFIRNISDRNVLTPSSFIAIDGLAIRSGLDIVVRDSKSNKLEFLGNYFKGSSVGIQLKSGEIKKAFVINLLDWFEIAKADVYTVQIVSTTQRSGFINATSNTITIEVVQKPWWKFWK